MFATGKYVHCTCTMRSVRMHHLFHSTAFFFFLVSNTWQASVCLGCSVLIVLGESERGVVNYEYISFKRSLQFGLCQRIQFQTISISTFIDTYQNGRNGCFKYSCSFLLTFVQINLKKTIYSGCECEKNQIFFHAKKNSRK